MLAIDHMVLEARPMRFALTDEQLMLRDAVRGTLDREASLARVRAWTERREAREPMAIAMRQGWTGIRARRRPPPRATSRSTTAG